MYSSSIRLNVNREFSVRELRDETADVGAGAQRPLRGSSHCVPKTGTITDIDRRVESRIYSCGICLNVNREFSVRELRDETADVGEPA